ncbi:pseudaminic acid synthase [Pseudomonas sp.]|uniref:pseudaminic acid synthase n=1 Tax=Pseudomonas sp. TaxID=306 RepID=UPI002D089244|nr:pseudaminic acid synthase [Pseudomonas sp.]HUE91250.1 pseudaminic acid synthase [Pseudomonas sp.]
MRFAIAGRQIGPGFSPYIIAELSANHNGQLERALATIDAAQRCGADAVKLQTYTADTMTIDCDYPEFLIHGGLWDGYKLYDLYRWAETPFEWHRPIFEHAHRRGITAFSTPFDESAVDLLEDLGTPAYKIASFETLDLPLIRYVASTGKPMVVSTGMASEGEIMEAVAAARDAGCRDLALLHCISSYPAPLAQANLRQIAELERRFQVVVGLSDHTLGTVASVAAVAMGASLIEKHFTLDRASKGPDSEFSIEPVELERLCCDSHDAWLCLGQAGYHRQPAEEGNKAFRRSVYFVRDLPAGSRISANDLRRIRPGLGLAPKHFDELIGRRLKVEVSRGTPTSWGVFDE